VLADTKSQADTPDGLEARRAMLKLLEKRGAAGVAEEMVPRLLGETTKAERPEIAERVRHLALANSPDAIAGAIRALMSRPDSTPLLASIHVPTLILVGEEDVVTPPAASEEMHRLIPGSQLVRIPRSGHLSSLEQPDAFGEAVTAFLDHRI